MAKSNHITLANGAVDCASPGETTSTIIGNDIDDPSLVISTDENIVPSTTNTLVFGHPLANKSDSYLLPFVRQTRKRGENLIVFDSSGSIYNQTARYFAAAGYQIFVIDPLNAGSSQSWNIIKEIRNTNNIRYAQTYSLEFSKTFLQNSLQGSYDQAIIDTAISLLNSLIMRIALDPNLEPSFGALFTLLRLSDAQIDTIFDDHTLNGVLRACLAPYRTYKIQRNSNNRFHVGILQTAFTCLNDEALYSVFGSKDSSFYIFNIFNPKTVCFVRYNRTNQEGKAFVTSLLKMVLMELGQSYLPNNIKVHIVVDDIVNIGYVYDLAQNINFLGDKSGFCAMIQNLRVLQILYPDNWENIINEFTLFLGCGFHDIDTANFFSELSYECNQTQERSGILRYVPFPKKARGEWFTTEELLSAGMDYMFFIVRDIGSGKALKYSPTHYFQ